MTHADDDGLGKGDRAPAARNLSGADAAPFAAKAVRREASPALPRPRPLNLQMHPAGTEAEIAELVRSFYDRVRADPALGPIFAAHVDDWDEHLIRLGDFWSSLLRGTARYSGSPVQKHAALPGLTEALFQRWLGLFRETCDSLPNRALAERAQVLAARIARSLWMGYQLQHAPGAPARDLGTG